MIAQYAQPDRYFECCGVTSQGVDGEYCEIVGEWLDEELACWMCNEVAMRRFYTRSFAGSSIAEMGKLPGDVRFYGPLPEDLPKAPKLPDMFTKGPSHNGYGL
jgi:hypothetical protein